MPFIDDAVYDAVATCTARRVPVAEQMRLIGCHVEAAIGFPPVSLAALMLLVVNLARLVYAQAAGWHASDVDLAVKELIAYASVLALGYVTVSQILEKRHRDQRKAKLDDDLEEIKKRDEVNRTTLTGQLEEIKKKAEWAAKDSEDNQKAMRDSLHAIRDDLQARNLELNARNLDNEALRRDFMAVSQQLQVANALNVALRDELREANDRLAKLSAELEKLNRGMDDALAHPS